MRRCLQLAQQGIGHVAPNPMVGALLVHNGKIIAEGYHNYYGGPHAEVNALNRITDATVLANATLYVSLEPCSHHGKTPPCADLILQKGIKNVVVGTLDPNPKVAGAGVARLKNAGVNVTVGVLAHEARALNRRFITYHSQQRPYIILKWAQTTDGFIDRNRQPGEIPGPIAVSSLPSHRLVHLWRSHEQAILVGKNTVINDNPSLTVRLVDGKNPTRVILDTHASLSGNLKVFDQSAPTLVINRRRSDTQQQNEWITIKERAPMLQGLMDILYSRHITSILVEGGAETLNSFINEGLWDEARIFTAPQKFGNGIKAPILPPAKGLTHVTHHLGLDTLNIVYNTEMVPSL